MSLFVWILLGLVAGFIASHIVNHRGEGIVLDVLLGIVGAIVGIGLFVAQLFGNDLPRFDFAWGHEGAFAAAVEQVWPVVEAVPWPPTYVVRSVTDLAQDAAFAEHLTRALGARGVTLETVDPQ